MTPTQLETLLNQWLQPDQFKDYCPNGLQLDAGQPISNLVCGVTANQALIDAAVESGADALLVHHGWFWKGESQPLTGLKGQRARSLFNAGISLLAYHLPLDAHAEMGNNAGLAQAMGWQRTGPLDRQARISIGDVGVPAQPLSGAQLQAQLSEVLGQEALWIDGGRRIEQLAWCTGAAQSYFQQAIDAGVDAFVTGEISEPMVHLAREAGVHYFAAGHHATERFGVMSLGQRLAEHGLKTQFIDVPSPV
ncbi:MAG: Nif3-like dinuclear metal center hexameric protein [Litorivicinus sp.]